MDYKTWNKINENLHTQSLGLKPRGTAFFINERPNTSEPTEEELQAQIRKSNEEIRKSEEKEFDSSFDEYLPFKESPKLGTPEFEAEFVRSLGDVADDVSQKFSNGMPVEDVLVKAPTGDEVMPPVDVVDDAMPEKRWDGDWLNWEDDFNKKN